jgi:hypothetical protein
MTLEISKQEMLDLINTEWESLGAVLDQVDREAMAHAAVESTWTVKDIMAHISAWEKLMIQWLEESLRGETPQRPSPGESWDDLDLFNEQLHQENKAKTLDEVLLEFGAIHTKAVETVSAMEESDLLDPGRFEWRKGDPIWHLVAGNTWMHYEEHRVTISNWIASES